MVNNIDGDPVPTEGTLRERYEAILTANRRLMADWQRIYAQQGKPPKNESLASPRWQAWYKEFLPVTEQVYALAYDLGIPFEKGGQASAEDYARVWEAVQLEMTANGGHRQGR